MNALRHGRLADSTLGHDISGLRHNLFHALLQVAIVSIVERRNGALDTRESGALAENTSEVLAVLEEGALAAVERLELERVDTVEEEGGAAGPGEGLLGVLLRRVSAPDPCTRATRMRTSMLTSDATCKNLRCILLPAFMSIGFVPLGSGVMTLRKLLCHSCSRSKSRTWRGRKYCQRMAKNDVHRWRWVRTTARTSAGVRSISI